MSNVSTGSDTALSVIEAAVKSALYTDKVSKGQLTEQEVTQLDSPVAISETTVVAGKSAEISSMILYSMCQMQGYVRSDHSISSHYVFISDDT